MSRKINDPSLMNLRQRRRSEKVRSVRVTCLYQHATIPSSFFHLRFHRFIALLSLAMTPLLTERCGCVAFGLRDQSFHEPPYEQGAVLILRCCGLRCDPRRRARGLGPSSRALSTLDWNSGRSRSAFASAGRTSPIIDPDARTLDLLSEPNTTNQRHTTHTILHCSIEREAGKHSTDSDCAAATTRGSYDNLPCSPPLGLV